MAGDAGENELVNSGLEGAAAMARASAISFGLIFLVCILLTVIGAVTDNVQLLSFAGLTWLVFLCCLRLLVEYTAQAMAWICRIGVLVSHVFESVPLVPVGQYVIQTIDRLTDRFFYALIGVCGFLAHAVSVLHIQLADGNADEVNVLRSIGAKWTMQALLAVIPIVFGITADAFRLFNNKKEADLVGRGTKFFTSFEFARCALVLTAGFWGRDTLQAAHALLAIPADSTIVPLEAFSQSGRDAAFTIYKRLGPLMFWIILGILPLLAVLSGLLTWMGNRARASLYKQRAGTYFRMRLQQRAVFAAGCWMLLLSGTVGLRSGDFNWWFTIFRIKLAGHALDQSLVRCVGPFRGANEAELACWETAEQDWDREFAQLIASGAKRVPAKQRAKFLKTHMGWRESLDNRYAKLEQQAASEAVAVRIHISSLRVYELSQYCRALYSPI